MASRTSTVPGNLRSDTYDKSETGPMSVKERARSFLQADTPVLDRARALFDLGSSGTGAGKNTAQRSAAEEARETPVAPMQKTADLRLPDTPLLDYAKGFMAAGLLGGKGSIQKAEPEDIFPDRLIDEAWYDPKEDLAVRRRPSREKILADTDDPEYDDFNSDLPPGTFPDDDYEDLNSDLRPSSRGTGRTGRDTESKGYLEKAWNQVLLGNYTDDVTALGTLGQVSLGLAGLDLPADVQDLTYDLTHWEWTPGHVGQTLLDAVGFIPGIGAVKNADELAALLKGVLGNADTLLPALKALSKNADEAGAVLKGSARRGGEAGTALKGLFGYIGEAADALKDAVRNTGNADDILNGIAKSTDEAVDTVSSSGKAVRASIGEPDELDKAIERYWDESGATGSLTAEGAGDAGKLDWDSVVSKKGETRLDHINRHSTPNFSRATHGVFNGDPQNVVNQAWNNRGRVDPIKDGMGGEIYNIPMKNAGYESGYNNTGVAMDYVTIIVKEGTSEVIAAFPSCGNYGY